MRGRNFPVRALFAAVTFGAVLLPAIEASATVDQPARSGDVVIIDAGNRQKDLGRGVSDTKWSLRLPDGAACPGDSMHDEWRVQSFIVPAAVDPATLTYESTKPAGDLHFALYDYRTHPFVQQLTRANDVAGQPGIIGDIPTLSFAVFPPGTLPPGNYRIGIACTLARRTAQYWDAAVVLAADPADQPGQLTWRLPSASSAAPSISEPDSGNGIFFAASAVAASLISLFLWRRRASSANPRTKEFR
jgi:hypothetical protein